jgi:hypothetical protein
MSELKFYWPIPKTSILTQSYNEHIIYAQRYGLCYEPKPKAQCPNGYYYPAYDFVTSPAIGCPVHPMADGNIVKIYPPTDSYGNAVKIYHGGGYVTIYAHLSLVGIEPGEYVTPNDVIGYTGWSGNVRDSLGQRSEAAAHIHVEARHNDKPFDFMPYMTDGYIAQPEPQSTSTKLASVNVESVFLVPAFPCKVKIAESVTKGLVLRWQPITGIKLITLPRGEVLTAYSYIQSGKDIWYLVTTPGLNTGWLAAYFAGEIYLEEVK